MPFVIDGHNLLWSIQKGLEDSGSIAAVRLCHIIGRYLKLAGENGEIVFDGAGPPDKVRFEGIGNLEVFFAGPGMDADAVIEEKIRASTAPRRLTVVSSDRQLRRAARARKAIVVKSEAFWSEVERRLSRGKSSKEPAAKRQGISESETEQWLKFFGFEQ